MASKVMMYQKSAISLNQILRNKQNHSRENSKVGIQSYQKSAKVFYKGEFHKIVKIKRLHGRKGDDV